MVMLRFTDDLLEPLVGTEVPSEVGGDVGDQVSFKLERALDYGGLFVSFLASRRAAGGEVNVVLKMLRPSIVRRLGEQAALVVRKEAVALGRLNERLPPTPFVVRLVDAGALPVETERGALQLPWTAVEHVSGGVEGTTLGDRVRRSMQKRGHAFGPARAALAIDCIAQGLAAAHEVGVVHRDLAPQVVLCSGTGSLELFKICDFGAARAEGLRATLGAWVIGTPGYVAPEHAGLVPGVAGTWTDVFSFAALIYFMLTGEHLHTGAPGRIAEKTKTLRESKGLSAELRAREGACRSIDQLLAWASSPKPETRQAEPLALAAMIGPHLRVPTHGEPAPRLSALPGPAVRGASSWSWSWLHQPEEGSIVRSVAWDGYGRALASTSGGLRLWDGTLWHPTSIAGVEDREVVFVGRIGAGRWLLGCDDGVLAVCTVGGVTARMRGPGGGHRHQLWNGDLDDIGVLVSTGPEGAALHALVGKRWLKPLPLPDVNVSSIARTDDATWLVAGRRGKGGYVAVYHPLSWSIDPIPTPGTSSFLATDAQPSRHVGVATALGGSVVWRDAMGARNEKIEGGHDLSAAAIDPLGGGWVAGAGRIWSREPSGTWRRMWKDKTRAMPIVSLACDVDRVFALFADGGIVAGRGELGDE